MSTKIALEIRTDLDLDFLQQDILFHLIRFMSFAQLRTSEGWTAPHKATIDIGTPISIIPRFIWKHAQVKWISLRKVTLTGIGSGKVQGRLGEVTLVFSDEQATSPRSKLRFIFWTIIACLSLSDAKTFSLNWIFSSVTETRSLTSNFPSSILPERRRKAETATVGATLRGRPGAEG